MATRPNTAARQRAALDRRASAETPASKAAQRKALAAARARANLAAAQRALQAGDYYTAAKALFSDASKAQLESDINVNGARVMVKGANLTMRYDVPSKYRLDGAAGMGSSGNVDPAVAAVKRIADRISTPFVDGAEQGVIRGIALGLEAGLNPRDVARAVRDGIGLSEYDVTLINTFASKLRGDPGSAFDNSLRDGRYDSTLAKAAAGELDLSESAIGDMIDRYASRLLDFRTESFARTVALTSMKEGTLVAWQEAAAAADAQMTKTWVTTLDGRERPTHHDMNGATVLIDQPWDVPEAGPQMTPGDNEFNCRCAMVFGVAG
jgi:hypothetical protein